MKDALIIPISQIWKLRHRGVKYLAWDHTAIKRESLFQCLLLLMIPQILTFRAKCTLSAWSQGPLRPRLCLPVHLSLTVLHPAALGPSLTESPTDAQRCSCIMLLCLCSHCFFPQDVFPTQSVWQTHFLRFNVKDACFSKPSQTASCFSPLEN